MSLTQRKLAETFSVELRGVDLRQPFDREKIEEIYEAFLEHGVVVLPGQSITIERQLQFARVFGELWEVPAFNTGNQRVGNAAITDVSNLDNDNMLASEASEKILFQLGNLLWHSDLSSNAIAAQASMLHAVEIVPHGGDTEFADLQAAYDAIPAERRVLLDTLIAEHSLAHSRIRGGYAGLDADTLRKLVPPSLHGVVRVHCETGRKGLYVGAHAARILGMDEAESTALIEELIAFTTQPSFVYTHRWAVGDLVIWDNRRTLHRGRPYDVSHHRRVMHRATIRDIAPDVVAGQIVHPDVRRRGPRLMTEPTV